MPQTGLPKQDRWDVITDDKELACDACIVVEVAVQATGAFPLKHTFVTTEGVSMPDPLTVSSPPRTIGMASDHGGYQLKRYLASTLAQARYQVVDFGDREPAPDDDYPDFVVPLARAVARGDVERGVAVCGSGVGACIAANKVPGVRACLIHESFSACQGVEDDDMNMMCLGGRVVGPAFAWELVRIFLAARFSGAERHRRRVAKVAELDRSGRHAGVGEAPGA